MRLHGNNADTLQHLQVQFKTCYPYLKIEFTSSGHSLYKATPQASIYKNHLKIGDTRRIKNNQDIDLELNDNLRVSELEQQLASRYGLYIQVFRKSGNTWLETTLTDSWTLKQQNDHGDEMSGFNSHVQYNRDYNADAV